MSKSHQRRRKARKRSLASFVIDFGQYRGKRLDQVPLDYVRWLATGCHDISVRWIAQQWLSMLRQTEPIQKG